MSKLARPDRDRPQPFDGETDEHRLTAVYPGWRRAGRRRLRRWLADELHDVQMIAESASQVYCHVTGGRISKPHTVASAVIGQADDLAPTEIDGVSWCIVGDAPWFEGDTRCSHRPSRFHDCVEAPLFHGPPIGSDR